MGIVEKRLIIGLGQGEYRVSLELLMPKSKEILNKQNDGDTMEIGKKITQMAGSA